MTSKVLATLLATLLSTVPVYAVTTDPDPDPEPEVRGDNGWGNGADTTNAGSFSGGTQSSKSTNGVERNDRNYPAALDKFDGR